MTRLLERAFAEASKLPNRQQDEVAAWILDELALRAHGEGEGIRPTGRVAEEATHYDHAPQGVTLGEADLKTLFKQALTELLQEQGDLLRDLLAQVVEDAAMVRAIDEGAATPPVSKAQVLQALEAAR